MIPVSTRQIDRLVVTTTSNPFAHEPLDHTNPSIRLLRVDPEKSLTGLIHCTLIHATVDMEYHCLSYTWGELTLIYDTLVNGKVMHDRQNLFDFMNGVREADISSLWLWIDAVWYVPFTAPPPSS
jgi:hypothetical protein